MIFWLLWKHEISYRVYNNLASLRGFFLKIIFLDGGIFEFP
jgi:hypothetical protein